MIRRPAGPGALALALALAGPAMADPPPRDYLTGGAWDVAGATALPRPADPFLGALFDGYADRARAEQAQYDWPDTAILVDRLRQVAAGDAPTPFDLADYDLAPAQAATLAPVRAELASLLANPGARLRAPVPLGQAQVAYDCWVEQMEEGWQTADIALCADHYATAATAIRAAAQLPGSFAVVLPEEGEIGGIVLGGVLLAQANAGAGTDGRTLPLAPEEVATTFGDALGAQPQPARDFTLTFAYNETVLDPPAQATVADIAADIAARGVAEVIVTGHADAPGEPGINRTLSRSRARRVAQAIEAAVPPGAVVRYRVAAKGETALLVPTALPEAQNRRVGVLVR